MPKLREVLKWEKFWCRTALWEYEHRWRLRYDKCQCECWTIKFVHHDHLIHWRTTNCWCKMYEVRSRNWKMNKKHWMEWTRPYKIFMGAKQRCLRKNCPSYMNYGWRWIKIEWNSFEEFWEDMWDAYYKHVQQYWEKDTTIERIDVNWNYCKDNCRRATWDEQVQNKTTNNPVIYKWVRYGSTSMLAKKFWINRSTLNSRIKHWWSIERAVLEPLLHTKNNVK